MALAAATAAAAEGERKLIGEPPATTVASRSDASTVQTLSRLRDKATREGTVRVIAGLRVPFAPQGTLSVGAAATQRSEIAATRATVLSRLSEVAGRAHAVKAFDTVPFVGLALTTAELDRLARMSEVSSINEDYQHAPTLAYSTPLIGANTAWSNGYTGAGQAVAVLDTGVDKYHPFLAGKVIAEGCYSSTLNPDGGPLTQSVCPSGVPESTFPDSGLNCASGIAGCDHGTHVAGIVAGANGVTAAPAGVAKGASIIAMQVFSYVPTGNTVTSWSSDQMKALERLLVLKDTYSIASVNMSLGGGQYTSQATCDSQNSGVKALIDSLRSYGIATVIASGNNGYTNAMSAPGCISTAVSVGATYATTGFDNSCLSFGLGTSSADEIACYSNSASFLNLLAPGGGIYASVLNNTYEYKGGTSMATPHVAGAWAVMKQKFPSASVTDILNAFISTGTSITDPRNSITKPRINLASALGAIGGATTYTLGVTVSGSGSVSSSPAGISCGATCSVAFAQGSVVALTATPSPGHSFAGWSGACSGAGTCNVTMTSARSVVATFSSTPHVTVSVTKAGAGSGTVTGGNAINCGSTCSEAVTTGTLVSLNATPASGSVFTGWSGACSGTGNCAISANADTSVTATFGLEQSATVTAINQTIPSTAAGSSQYYSVTTPAGARNLVIRITGGSGTDGEDADLYVKTGSVPTLASFDCRPYFTGNEESCSLATPDPNTTYYIMVNGWTAFSGVQLIVTYQQPASVSSDITNVINLLLLSQ